MPKNQSRAAKRARAAARRGAKYTTALRENTGKKSSKKVLTADEVAELLEAQKPASERMMALYRRYVLDNELRMKSIQAQVLADKYRLRADPFMKSALQLEKSAASAIAVDAFQRSVAPMAGAAAARGMLKMRAAAHEALRLKMQVIQMQVLAETYQRKTDPFMKLAQQLEKTSVMAGAVEAFWRDVEPLLPKLVFPTED